MKNLSNLRTFTLVLLVAAGGVVLSGCNFISNKISEKVSETMIERAGEGKVDVDMDGEAYTITTDEGTMTVGSKDISGVTKYVEVPDWITANESSGVMSSETEEDITVYAALESSKSVEETYAYWEKYFTDKGFTNITKADYSGTKMISGVKDEEDATLAITVSTPEDSSATMVTIAYSTESE